MEQNMEGGRKKHHLGRWIAIILLLCFLLISAMRFAPGQVPFPISLVFSANPFNTVTDWNLTLVNWEHKIPWNWNIELTELSNGQRVDSRIYPPFQQMFDDMRAQGVYPVVASGYRTAKSQQALMDDKIDSFCVQGYSKSQAKAEAKKWVAEVGYSEHQTGLAVDINADGIHSAGMEVYAWLADSAWKYGSPALSDGTHMTAGETTSPAAFILPIIWATKR